MFSRTINLSIPLPPETTFDLLLQAGEQLPRSTELAGIQLGRWENTIADRESGQLEWRMFDHDFSTITLQASIQGDESGQSQIVIKVNRRGQILDPLGLYKETIRLLTDPFLDLVKQHIKGTTG